MTEAGKDWAFDVRRRVDKWPVFGNDQAEFWLRAFCEEVERRAQEICLNSIMPHKARWLLLLELKRELLGKS